MGFVVLVVVAAAAVVVADVDVAWKQSGSYHLLGLADLGPTLKKVGFFLSWVLQIL